MYLLEGMLCTHMQDLLAEKRKISDSWFQSFTWIVVPHSPCEPHGSSSYRAEVQPGGVTGLLDADGPKAGKLSCSNILTPPQGPEAVSGVMRKRNKDGKRPAAIQEGVALSAPTPKPPAEGRDVERTTFSIPQSQTSAENQPSLPKSVPDGEIKS